MLILKWGLVKRGHIQHCRFAVPKILQVATNIPIFPMVSGPVFLFWQEFIQTALWILSFWIYRKYYQDLPEWFWTIANKLCSKESQVSVWGISALWGVSSHIFLTHPWPCNHLVFCLPSIPWWGPELSLHKKDDSWWLHKLTGPCRVSCQILGEQLGKHPFWGL